MNDAVVFGAWALFGSMGAIVVIALLAAALMAYLDPRIDHGDDH